MRILSVKILGQPFRSLATNKLYKFNFFPRADRLSTKVFAGLNGSGKSNFLELFSEIFYYLEIYHLSSVSLSEKKNKNIGFEIEYLLPANQAKVFSIFNTELSNTGVEYVANNQPLTNYTREQFEELFNDEIENIILDDLANRCRDLIQDEYIHVRITKELDDFPVFTLKKHADGSSIQVKQFTTLLLPKKIIAYTSGQNELLSNPYYKIKYHYFKESSKISAFDTSDLAEDNRLFFLDYSNNFSIFVANMLLASKEKISYLSNILNIAGLKSFRITINLVDIYKRTIPISDRLVKQIGALKNCATAWVEKSEGKEKLLVLDYFVTEATTESFRFYFKSAFELFKVFYELDILNLHLVKKDTRDLMLKVFKSFNFSDELPKSDPYRLVFRLEQIVVKKIFNNEERLIYYKGLSDGEHQFNEVIGTVLMMEQEGCLFLLDEPDTHFNPLWRAKMIKMLNFVAAETFEKREKYTLDENYKEVLDENNQPIKERYLWPLKVRKQEIIITTHSPFIISDSQTQDVYKFSREDGVVCYETPDIVTYGASTGLILEALFNRDISISDFSNEELIMLKDSIRSLDDIEKIKKALSKFGESVEKFDAVSFLLSKEEEFKANRKDDI
jgi:restriction system-associated AAA family ATPase